MFVAPVHRSVVAPSGIIRDGLVARWPMDEGSGLVVGDDSGNGYHGNMVVLDETAWVPGIGIGPYSINYQGFSTSAKIDCGPYTAMNDSAISGCARIRPTSVSNGGILTHGAANGFRVLHFSIRNSSQIRFLLGNSSGGWGMVFDADITVPLSPIISHLAFTWDGTTARVYLNGVEGDSRAYADTLITTVFPDLIIGNTVENGHKYNGVIDDVRLYQRALSQPEVQQISDGTG